MRKKDEKIRDPQSPIRNLIVIASSAGGIAPLMAVISKLPKGLEAAVIVVQHLSEKKKTGLPELLGRNAHLKVSLARDGMPIESGHVYVAEPGKHLLVEGNTLTVTLSKKIHFVRPSADLLFVSAASSFEHRVIGVVLSGTGKDGALGCVAVKAKGGVTLAQNKATAGHYGMPQSAIDANAIDRVLSPDHIVQEIVNLVNPAPPSRTANQPGRLK